MADWIKPAAGFISSGFGRRNIGGGASTNHLGTDIGCGVGTAVVASAAGTVVFAGESAGYGYLVIIDHGNGHRTYYAHLSYISVRYGQQVAQGQAIGASGGKKGAPGAGTSTGPHLHTEHRINGVAHDPLPFWTAAATASTGKPIQIKEHDMADRYVVRESDGSQAIFGALHWFDFSDGNRAEITARQMCPDQVIAGRAIPEKLSAHEFQINWESYCDRISSTKSRLGLGAGSGAVAIDYDELAARLQNTPIDYATLARAVNDDAARRMRE